MEKTQHHPLVQFLDFDFNPTFQYEGDWSQSDYGQNQQRHLDKEVRNSFYRHATLKNPIQFPKKNQNYNGKWRVIKYEDGKFVQHQDHLKAFNHIGTQILIFPKKQSEHYGGELIVFNNQDPASIQRLQIQAQPHVYVYVFIPLGYKHEVKQVEGVRTVATRMVTKNSQILDYSKNSKSNNNIFQNSKSNNNIFMSFPKYID